ncbi:hypothetical protein BC829DRAFT_15980 [Chytridium lagenaria]|nr:hypothetical protein BC829DRAFT_120660 [Chytridium lagenaria]KAI8841232.1 hypothetical protein BC829DRAFT_15980 [Chytridium lagenaria]
MDKLTKMGPPLLLAACARFLRAVARQILELFSERWDVIKIILLDILRVGATEVKIECLKIVGELISQRHAVEAVEALLPQFVGTSLRDSESKVRLAALEAISSIPESALAGSTDDGMREFFNIVKIGIEDSDSNVRGAAYKVIGMLIGYVNLIQKLPFLHSAIKIILFQRPGKQGLSERIWQSWAFANFLDAISTDEGSVTFKSLFPSSVWNTEYQQKINQEDPLVFCFEKAIAFAEDNEKCRPNGLRSIGTFFSLACDNYLQSGGEGSVKRAADNVVQNLESGPFKVDTKLSVSVLIRAGSMECSPRRPKHTIFFLSILMEKRSNMGTCKSYWNMSEFQGPNSCSVSTEAS